MLVLIYSVPRLYDVITKKKWVLGLKYSADVAAAIPDIGYG